jgi:hypothetical protein
VLDRFGAVVPPDLRLALANRHASAKRKPDTLEKYFVFVHFIGELRAEFRYIRLAMPLTEH